jgi:hypothetical protein
MADLVFLDNDGNEVSRKVKGKGRPPKGAEKREDGNFYVTAVVSETSKPKYIVLDKDGNKVSEEPKGKGRPKPDFVKAEEGEFKGNWVKRETVVSA